MTRTTCGLFLPVGLAHHQPMNLMQFFFDALAEWVRDTAINLSGRLVDEFVGRRIKRRRAHSKGRRKGKVHKKIRRHQEQIHKTGEISSDSEGSSGN